MTPGQKIQRLKNPPLLAPWKAWRLKRQRRLLLAALREMPNAKVGDNVFFSSVANIGFINKEAQFEIGNDCFLFADMMLSAFESGQLKIGHSCVLSGGQISCRYKITIGDRFMCGRNVIIEDTEGHPVDPSWRSRQADWMVGKRTDRSPTPTHPELTPKEKAFFDKYPFAGQPPWVGKNIGEIVIGNNVWVGRNSTIRKGVHIGDNSVIATGAVVTRDIPANCVAGGIPAKPIKQLEPKDFNDIMDEVLGRFPDYQGDAHGSW